MRIAVVSPGRSVGVQPITAAPGWHRRRLIRIALIALAALSFAAAVLVLGPVALIPYGLLLAAASDSRPLSRTVLRTPRTIGLAGVLLAGFAWFWLRYFDLTTSTLVVIAGGLIALPLALHDAAADGVRDRTVVVTRRNLVLAIWGLVVFGYLYQERGLWMYGVAAVCVAVPFALVVSRTREVRRGRVEFGLLRHPFRRGMRAQLIQGVNILLLCALLGGVIAAGGIHRARIEYALDGGQFAVVVAGLAAGLVLLAVVAVLPARRVQLATNLAVALLSSFLVVQLVQHPSLPPIPSCSRRR